MKQKYLLVFFLLLVPFGLFSQEIDSLKKTEPERDSIIPLRRRPWIAAAEVFGTNVAIWAFDYYILKGDYANISMHSMRTNLREGFHWDNDKFSTNLFSHPYHGSMYFSTARANGMNFWESSLYAFGGSMMWELFMECELPAGNDLISTTFGGIALGESLFRVSDIVFDNRTWGWERIGREVLGTLLSPGRGLTRVLTGQSWKRGLYSGKQFEHPDIFFELSFGTRAIEMRNLWDDDDEDIFDEDVLGLCFDARMVYGNIFDNENTLPYDYFYLHANLNIQRNQPIIGQLNFMGRLWGNNLFEKKRSNGYWGFFQHFDYYDSDTLAHAQNIPGTKTPYKLGSPAALGVGFVMRGNAFKERFIYNIQAHVNGVLIASSLSDYSRPEERNYNWGSGYSAKFKLYLSYKKFVVEYNNEFYHIFTWNGYDPDDDNMERPFFAQGDKSNALYYVMESKIGYNFNERWGLYWQRFDYFRTTNYTYHPDFKSTTSDTRLLAVFRF